MQTAFSEYKIGSSYYDLIIPKGTSTTYWVASRYISADTGLCYFSMNFVSSGGVDPLRYVPFGRPTLQLRARVVPRSDSKR